MAARCTQSDKERCAARYLPPQLSCHPAPFLTPVACCAALRLPSSLHRRLCSITKLLQALRLWGRHCGCRLMLQVVIVAGEVIRRYGAAGSMSEEREPQERHPQGGPCPAVARAEHLVLQLFWLLKAATLRGHWGSCGACCLALCTLLGSL